MTVVCAGLVKRFGSTHALDGVDLELVPGELLAVLGPSGCGKTTLLRAIAGFEAPDAGTITVAGEQLSAPGRWVAPEKRRIGMVFQDYALFPHLDVEANVAFGLARRPKDERERLVARTLELVGLQHRADSHPHELSGGERQRVALARALAPEPATVLLDEPFSSLDATLRAELRREVGLILREAETTALLVTHDQEEALSLADRLAVMRDGRIVALGPPEEVYARPSERWTAQFVGEVNVLSGVAETGGARTEIGLVALAAMASGAVQVAVRPEQLELLREHAPNAEVVGREFRGHDVLYRVRHEGGTALVVQLPSLALFDVGEPVYVRPSASVTATVVD